MRTLAGACDSRGEWTRNVSYWIALLTCEKTLLAFEPISRTVPTTITRITAIITEYSAMSCPS